VTAEKRWTMQFAGTSAGVLVEVCLYFEAEQKVRFSYLSGIVLVMLPARSSLALHFQAVYWVQTCKTVHRCLHSEEPRYLADLKMLSAAATTRAGLRSATPGSVAVPWFLSLLGDFVPCGCPTFFKNLPSPLRGVHSVDNFIRQLETFLFAALAFFIAF